ncbi:pyruvate kinase [Orbaceae bacterium ESL0727]|nr:pyruvate kinase [Orbaceae bacterium ESL0727]
MKKTKMICTISSSSLSLLTDLATSGVDIFRLDCSQGNYDEYRQCLTRCRQHFQPTNQNSKNDIALMVDITANEQDLRFACEQQVDFVAISFLQTVADIHTIRHYLDTHHGKHIAIIAKIEHRDELAHFDAILAASDGIMLVRRELSSEIASEEIILVQKALIKKCNDQAKPIIIATQLLESMIVNPRPTRAEASDVANAILDGADAVMLSDEITQGKYPIESARMMATICQQTDTYATYKRTITPQASTIIDAVSYAAVCVADNLAAPIIAVMTQSSEEAKAIRKYFPKSMILAVTSKAWLARQLALVKGVYPCFVDEALVADDFIKQCGVLARQAGLIVSQATFVAVINKQTASQAKQNSDDSDSRNHDAGNNDSSLDAIFLTIATA